MERRNELDWLRVSAVFLLIYFHSARIFDPGGFLCEERAIEHTQYRLFHIYPFIAGFLLYSSRRMGSAIDKNLKNALVLAVALSPVLVTLSTTSGFDSQAGTVGDSFTSILFALCTWFWIIALVGLARRHLNFRNRFLGYANQGSCPFYILHQTVIVLVGYWVVQWSLATGLKYSFITTAAPCLTLLLYEFAVRRTRITRFLFGMPDAKRVPPQERLRAAP